MFTSETQNLVYLLLDTCKRKGIKIAVAESCTGGLLGAAITSVPGTSEIFESGFITYANRAKTEMLAVPATLIQTYGAVSSEVAKAMAEGALKSSHAALSLAITGIAGPAGGSDTKPIGLVYIACAQIGSDTIVKKNIFQGSRNDIRLSAVTSALNLLLEAVS